ncbi:MAG: hypothetical protein AAF492_06505 [Verrucomicrobiota bacterium]
MHQKQTIHGLFLILTLFFAAPTMGSEFDTLKKNFERSVAKQEQFNGIELDELHIKYLALLKKIKTWYSQKGELEPTLFVTGEIKRFIADKSHPDLSASAQFTKLNSMQKSYLYKIRGIEKRQNLAMIDLGEKYEKSLVALEAKLTRTDRLEDALKVRNARIELKGDSRFRVREDLLVKANVKAPVEKKSAWFTLFRGRNPSIWNSRVEGDDTMAVPTSEAPADTKYLRLMRMDTRDYVIVDIGPVDLSAEQIDGAVRWTGARSSYNSVRSLGVYDPDRKSSSSPGHAFLYSSRFGYRYKGWGFGPTRSNLGGYTLGYSWDGEKLPGPVTFDIAVKSGPLTRTERGKMPAAMKGGAGIQEEGVFTLGPKDAIRKGQVTVSGDDLSGINGENHFAEWNLGQVKPGRYEVFITYKTVTRYSYNSSSFEIRMQAVRNLSRHRGDTFKLTSDATTTFKKVLSGSSSYKTVSLGQVTLSHLLKFQLAFFERSTSYLSDIPVKHIQLKPIR